MQNENDNRPLHLRHSYHCAYYMGAQNHGALVTLECDCGGDIEFGRFHGTERHDEREKHMINLEEYFTRNATNGIIDYRVRYQPGPLGAGFYIHPDGKDGDTLDYAVSGDHLELVSHAKR